MKEELEPVSLSASAGNSEPVMPPAAAVAAASGAEDAWGADSEAALASALEALRAPAVPPAALPDGTALVARLARALPAHDTRFLDDYLSVLISHNDTEIKFMTDQLMRSIEGALAAGDPTCGVGGGGVGAGGVVLSGWLAAAIVWRAPRLPAAARALHYMLVEFQPNQVEELARALNAALEARELMAVSDAVRNVAARGQGARVWSLAGGAGTLAALLLRAALAKLLAQPVDWRAGALSVEEVNDALATRWARLGAEAQLAAARLAGRTLATAAARGERSAAPAAARLLSTLAHPPPPHLRHHPDYLKVIIALTKLQMLFKSKK